MSDITDTPIHDDHRDQPESHGELEHYIEDMIVLAIRAAQTVDGGGEIIKRAVQRARSHDDIRISGAPEGDPSLARRREISIMVRHPSGLVEGTVETDTLFATFPAGTPIVRETSETYADSLAWLKNEDLLEVDAEGVQRLREPVRFVTPHAAMALIMGANKAWVGEDERRIDWRSFDATTMRDFVKTGVKVRRA